MTLSTTTNTAQFTGDNSTVAFAFPHLFFANGDLTVTSDGVTKVLDTDYTVTGAGLSAGGTVTYVTAPATDVAVVIQRIVSFTQNTDFENFDGNPADVTEKQFDLGVMQTQQLSEQTDRTILSPIGTTLTTNTIIGDIDSTIRVLTISTAGPDTATIASLSASLDVLLTSEASGDMLKFNGTNWINRTASETRTDLSLGALALLATVDTAQIDNNAITLAKLAHGTANKLIGFDGSGVPSEIEAAGVPVGTTIEYSGTSTPTGFLDEDGAAVSRTTFASLFAVVSTTFGVGDGSTTFNVPNSQRRTAVGAGGSGTGTLGNAVGDTGGSETHALTSGENAAHTHSVSWSANNGSTANSWFSGLGLTVNQTRNSGSSGSGTAHNIMQKSIVKMKCIKF